MAGKILFERSTFIKPKCRYYPKPEFFCFEKKLNDATTMATLSYQKGKDTFETVHMWTQIVGKIKLALLPWINHSWLKIIISRSNLIPVSPGKRHSSCIIHNSSFPPQRAGIIHNPATSRSLTAIF